MEDFFFVIRSRFVAIANPIWALESVGAAMSMSKIIFKQIAIDDVLPNGASCADSLDGIRSKNKSQRIERINWKISTFTLSISDQQ